jgi:hypothetical protein
VSARALGSAVLIEGEEALRYLKFAQLALVRKLERDGLKPHPELTAIADATCAALQSMSQVGQVDGSDEVVAQECSPDELIGTVEAAQILGVTRRQAVRLARSLDGQQLPNGTWVFRRGAVEDYRKARRDARSRSGTAA